MKKTIVFVGLLVLSCFMLFASGSAEGSEKPVEIIVNEEYIGNKNAKTIITVATSKDNTVAAPYEAYRDWAYKSQYAWAERHPDYGIELQYIDSSNIAVEMSKILTEAEMGVAPDVIHVDSYYLGLFKDAGVLQPLNDLIPQEDLDAFFEWTKPVTCKNGIQYALWGETDARVLYYRNDLIDTPPRTWDELIEIGSKVSQEAGINGYMVPAGLCEGASNEATWPNFWGLGGEIIDEETGRPVLGEGENRQKLIDVYTFLKRLVDSGAAPIDIASTIGSAPIIAEVAAGNVAMFQGGTWVINQFPSLVEDPSIWSYTFLPMKDADSYATTCGGWTWAIITEDKDKQEAAASFLMEVMVGKEAMEKRCLAQGQIPVRVDTYGLDSFKSDENMANFYEHFEYGHTRPASSMYPFISDANAKTIGRVLMGEITPEEAVDALQQLCIEEWEANYKN